MIALIVTAFLGAAATFVGTYGEGWPTSHEVVRRGWRGPEVPRRGGPNSAHFWTRRQTAHGPRPTEGLRPVADRP
jgi:hypothetical protein